MGLFRYRETGELVTETEFRFRNRKRRPQTVPPMGELTEAWLNNEGIDVVFEGPQGGPVLEGAVKYPDGRWYTTWFNG